MPVLSLACHLPHNTPHIPSRYNNEQTTKQTKAINNSYIYINISCKCDTNRAGHFTLDAYASRPVACIHTHDKMNYNNPTRSRRWHRTHKTLGFGEACVKWQSLCIRRRSVYWIWEEKNFQIYFFILRIDILNTPWDFGFRWVPQNLIGDTSTLIRGDGLVPSGNKPYIEPKLTQICVDIYGVSIVQEVNELNGINERPRAESKLYKIPNIH